MTENEREEARRHLLHKASHASAQKRIRWRLGHRGAFLVLMGVLYIILAVGYGMPLPAYVYQQLAMPIQVASWVGISSPVMAIKFWAGLWATSGIAAVITAWWPPGKDGWGFVALWAFSALWAILNLWGGLILGAPRAVVIGIIFAIYALTVVIVSGMPDPPPVVRALNEEDNLE